MGVTDPRSFVISNCRVCSPCYPVAARTELRYFPSEAAATFLPSAYERLLPTSRKTRMQLSFFSAHGLGAAKISLFTIGSVKVNCIPKQTTRSQRSAGGSRRAAPRCAPMRVSRPSQPIACPTRPQQRAQPYLRPPRLPLLRQSQVPRSHRRGRNRGWITPSWRLCLLWRAAKPAEGVAASFRLAVSSYWELLNEVALLGPRGVFSSPPESVPACCNPMLSLMMSSSYRSAPTLQSAGGICFLLTAIFV